MIHTHTNQTTGETTESNVPTSELRTGDLVYTGIGLVELVGPQNSRETGERAGDVYWFDGRILGFDPANNADHRWARGINRPDRPENEWTVQGNDLARWTRVRTV